MIMFCLLPTTKSNSLAGQAYQNQKKERNTSCYPPILERLSSHQPGLSPRWPQRQRLLHCLQLTTQFVSWHLFAASCLQTIVKARIWKLSVARTEPPRAHEADLLHTRGLKHVAA